MKTRLLALGAASAFTLTSPVPAEIFSAVLPSSRAVQTGEAATLFGTILNNSPGTATNCAPTLGTTLNANFSYQTTDANNALIGMPDTPVDVPASASQSFLLVVEPTAAFPSTTVKVVFDCTNTAPAPVFTGVNTAVVTATSAPTPDLIAIASTPTADGVLRIPGENTTALFAAAAVNIGVGGTMVAEADTGLASIPVDVSVCPTNADGVCLAPPGVEAPKTVLSGDVQTFNVFARSSGPIAFDPVANRINVRFATLDGGILGSTSVALTSAAGGSNNAAPIADAGEDQVWEGGEVTLNGTGSSDPDGDAIAFAWALARPKGSAASLADPNSEKTSFTPDVPGQYVAQLVVADQEAFSIPDVVVITATGQLDVTASFETLTLELGGSVNLTTTVAYADDGSGEMHTVAIDQQVTPDIGLAVTPTINGEFIANNDTTQVYNQVLTPSVAGGYEITTTATIEATGESATVVSQLAVIEPSSDPILFTPGANPSVAPPDETTSVRFTTRIDNLDGTGTVEIVSLDGLFMPITMNDTGGNGDLLADDGVFSATVVVNSSLGGLSAGDCAEFQTVLIEGGDEHRSPVVEVCFSAYGGLAATPAGTPVFNGNGSDGPSAAAPANAGGESVIANELFVYVIDGLSEHAVGEIAASINAQVVGGLPQENLYQLRLNTMPASREALQALADALASRPDILAVELNAVGTFDAVSPSDPSFGSQGHLVEVRADEAWVVARGWSFDIIGIVDSGVNLQHPDLDGRILGTGLDLSPNPGANADDTDGHGTGVAGVAAAETDNGIHVAGMTWSNPIYPVKLSDVGEALTVAVGASGIRAAADAGALVINNSWGFYESSAMSQLCSAVTYARNRGAIVVGTSGNYPPVQGQRLYPAACSGVIAVGASDGGTVAGFSNTGSWVDIAAPGVSILTTAKGGGTYSPSGTSFAAPAVTGVIALIAGREAGLSGPRVANTEIVRRLRATATLVSSLSLIGGRKIDAFEAVFNGDFEDPALSYWTRLASGQTNGGIASATPRSGNLMGYVSTGPGGQETTGGLSQRFVIQEGVTRIPISFEWAFLSEEFNEYCNTEFDDDVSITLTHSGGTATLLQTSVNELCAANDDNLPDINTSFDQGDVKWTGWQHCSMTVDVAPGEAVFSIQTTDAGDEIYDTVVLVDAIRFNNDALPNQGPNSQFCGAASVQAIDWLPLRELTDEEREVRRKAYRERWGYYPNE